MERNNNNELESLFCKIGARSDTERQRVSDMFNAVFNSFGGGDTSSSSSPSSCWSAVVVHPATFALRTELKRHVRRNPWAYLSPLKLATAVKEAEAECSKVIALVSKYASGEEDLQKLDKLQVEAKEECRWFEKVNEWKREMLLKENFDGAVKSFKNQLLAECRLDEVVAPSPPPPPPDSKKPNVRAVGNRLMRAIITESAGEFSNFEEEAEVSRWLHELYQEFSQVLEDAFRKSSEHTMSLALTGYKAELDRFLREHLFTKEEAVKVFQLQLQAKYEQQQELALAQLLLEEPAMRSVWEARIIEETAMLETGWRAKQDGAIAEFRMGLKNQAQRIAGEEHNVQLENTELEALFTNDFPRVLRQLLENAKEAKTVGKCFPTGDEIHGPDAEAADEVVGEDQKKMERTRGDQPEEGQIGEDQQSEEMEEKSGGVSIKVEPGAQVPIIMTAADEDNKGASDKGSVVAGSRRNSTLLTSIWIIVRDAERYHHNPVFPKGIKFPTPSTTTLLSLYLGRRDETMTTTTTTLSIPFYEKDCGKSQLLGKLEIRRGGIGVASSGVAHVPITCHIDSSGVFHAEVESTRHSGGNKRFAMAAKTCTNWGAGGGGGGGGGRRAEDWESSGGRAAGRSGGGDRKRRSSGGSSSSSSSSSRSRSTTSSHKRSK